MSSKELGRVLEDCAQWGLRQNPFASGIGLEDGCYGSGVLGWDANSERLTLDEAGMLSEFWDLVRGSSTRTDRAVGHNIFDFDLKFIYKRSVIFGVRPSVDRFFRPVQKPPHIRHNARMGAVGFGSKIVSR